MNNDQAAQPLPTYKIVGRILGPLVFASMIASAGSQDVMEPLAWRTAGVALWMAIWWSTEAVPVAVTALLPLVIFEPVGISSIRDAATPYATPVIYLVLGGFMMALAVERWNLHRRISVAILDRTGTDGRRLIGGFMLVCALLSMWMTNTSTTMMLLPIVLSVITVMHENAVDVSEKSHDNFQVALLLGVAYAASIGGLATLIGTPTNALLVGYLGENFDIEISFARWMAFGVPVSLVMLPVAWLVLTRMVYPFTMPASKAVDDHLHDMRREMGPMTTPERRVAILVGTVITCWILRRPLTEWLGLNGVSDAGIVMVAAILLFVIPSGDSTQRQLLKWSQTSRLPWGVLILFGGGLSLASAVSESGLALWLGEALTPLNAWGIVVLVIAAVSLVVFLTELTSNMATAATLLPVMGALALQSDIAPIVLTIPVTVAATCAFMLPVATPPNAIVFSTGTITIPQMVRAGIVLNLIAIVIVSFASLVVAPALLG